MPVDGEGYDTRTHHVGRHVLPPPERQRPLTPGLSNLFRESFLPRLGLAVAAELMWERACQ